MPPVRPMLARAVHEVPRDESLLYEPKWDGFRCIAFRDGEEIELGSRSKRPLTRYFPDLVAPLQAALPQRCVVDGEIVIVTESGLDFDALQNRLHPADSRVRKLAVETPATFVAFDLLATGEADLTGRAFTERRRELENDLAQPVSRVHRTPLTSDPDVAADWFIRFEGAGFDGVMAKPAAAPYQQDKRVMWKVKHERTAECVVAGFRRHKDGNGVGSLLLGLYDRHGALQHVGVASSFSATRRAELVAELAGLRDTPMSEHPWGNWTDAEAHRTARLPGGQNRWSSQKDLSWEPLRPELVAEVRYEHVLAGRFRHGGKLVRFRNDRDPRSCTYDQLDEAPPTELATLFDTKPESAP